MAVYKEFSRQYVSLGARVRDAAAIVRDEERRQPPDPWPMSAGPDRFGLSRFGPYTMASAYGWRTVSSSRCAALRRRSVRRRRRCGQVAAVVADVLVLVVETSLLLVDSDDGGQQDW
ncbi:hypothetical protein [Kitasatospora cystarginea]|uniref:hypothetical protein n=1 Tax=Kitasatospora cystarginea TaxID=58350 RepID=UPI0031E178CE